jgi:hypothetical protein
MRNNGLFSTIFISEVKQGIKLDDRALGRMATLGQTWRNRDHKTAELLWNSFMKQALSYLQFVPPNASTAPGVYPLYEDWAFSHCLSVLYLIEPGADIDDTAVGRFWPAKLLKELRKQKLNWGILTDGAKWRLYSTKSSRPYEDFVELSLAEVLEKNDEGEYGLFERFFHKDSFIPEKFKLDDEEKKKSEGSSVYKCRLDRDKEDSEKSLDEYVKKPLLYQIDEILQYLCNGFIADTTRRGDEYTEEERKEIFESSVKLLYRCLFLFYAEARRLLPSEVGKAENYSKRSIRALCREAHKFQWGKRKDYDGYDLWKHLKGLTNAVNDGDSDYGIMGYNGGLFDDEQEKFLGRHRLRNDSLSRALYLLAYVEPYNNNPDDEYEIPYEDLEVRHLGELYENILEYTVLLADADRIRRRTKKGVGVLLASEATRQKGDTLIKKGDVYFGETALERKQTGSYYTPEPLVRFLNTKTDIDPLRESFEKEYRKRFSEFLDQASSGQDEGSRRGAARAAIAIVERFVNEVVLDFKVCDLAMGSGHFLVDAANQMAGLVVELLAEIPNIKGLSTKVTSNLNEWRRLVTRNCLYGVDLNPLAVDLAKLSLWLNCFAINHKLTFLDHHLRCGNSLIGLRTLDQLKTVPKRKNEKETTSKQQVLPYFDDLSKILIQASKTIEAIPDIEEDDTDRQKTMFEKAYESTFVRLVPLADLYTAYLMDSNITEEQYRGLFSYFAAGRNKSQIGDRELKDVSRKVEDYKKKHQFFHWALEFPDAFNKNGIGGFNAAVGNPPWDIVKPNSQEFFSNYDPEFRAYGKQEANRVAEQLMSRNPSIRERWEICCNLFKEQSSYFREPTVYEALGKGDINTCKLFLEQFFTLLSKVGRMGIVVPSGIYTDQGCQPLRELFFSQSRIGFLYCFENRRAVFNIHRSFKFVLFGTQKGGSTDRFKCAFMEHDPERLSAIDANALKMSLKQVKKFSPDTLSVMEFKNQRDIDVTSQIYGDWPLLGDKLKDTWNVKLTREFDTSTDSIFFKEEPSDCPLYEGKIISSYDNRFSPVTYWLAEEDVRQREIQRNWKEFSKRHKEPYTYDYLCFRCGFRRIAASTNERTCLSTIIPPMATCPDTTVTVSRVGYNSTLNHATELISLDQSMVLLGFLNSFALDFVVRQKITTHLDMHFMYGLPVPRGNMTEIHSSGSLRGVIPRVARLVCADRDYDKMWAQAFRSDWTDSDFWYPLSAPIDTYGPAHEREIRRRLRNQAKNLTPKWGPHCGVHDRLPDRRDTGDRAQLRAEIDAYVAHLYGLSRDDFGYILDTFPVLKKKEEKAFGEFMSKRKCLEEFDRIVNIL